MDGTVTIPTDGRFETLNAGETLTDSFGYLISDGQTGGPGRVTPTINGRNDRPALAGLDGLATLEGGPSTARDLADFGSNADGEEDGATLDYRIVEEPADRAAAIVGTELRFAPRDDFEGLAKG